MFEFLSGYKTYLVCAAAIVTAVAMYASGTTDLAHMIETILAALGGMTLRAGISKV